MPSDKKDDKPVPLMTRFFYGCLLLLGGIIALTIALQLAVQVWGWLLLLAILGLLIGGGVWYLRWRNDRRW